MAWALLALGLVCVIEGLVYVLAPSAVEEMLKALQSLSLDQRRVIGLIAVTLGVLLVWLGRSLGA